MRTVSALLMAGLIGVAAGAAHGETVGSVGAVNQSAHGTPPGSAKRSLAVGLGVHRRERIETSTDGTAQILFNDTSTMSVGRNSAVTVDDFAYSGGAGNQGVSVARGVMRFVGGGVSHVHGANVRTPTASIGVRGGIAMIAIGGGCGTLVVHQFGVITVSNAINSQSLTRAGWGVCAPANGPVSEPFQVPPEKIAWLLGQTASHGRQTGGVQDPPTNYEANLRLGHIRPPDVVDPPGLDALNPFWTGNAIVQSGANTQNQPTPPPVRGNSERYVPGPVPSPKPDDPLIDVW